LSVKTRIPMAPPLYEVADVSALQALQRGDASENQQKRALDWIIQNACGTYDFHYHQTDRDTSFSLGRGFVGQQIVKLLKLSTTSLLQAENKRKGD
jgi:hypothetical protein